MFLTGVMMAVDAAVAHLKSMSKQVTTPEEISQVTNLYIKEGETMGIRKIK